MDCCLLRGSEKDREKLFSFAAGSNQEWLLPLLLLVDEINISRRSTSAIQPPTALRNLSKWPEVSHYRRRRAFPAEASRCYATTALNSAAAVTVLMRARFGCRKKAGN